MIEIAKSNAPKATFKTVDIHSLNLEETFDYDNLPKFYSYFEEKELKEVLREAGFDLLDVFTTGKESSYQTHPYVHAFCKKNIGTHVIV
jgi:hypothetical protein